MVSFTPEQQKAIELRNRNILVSAAAGSGKTAVLVERILQRICDEKDPVDIDRLLIMTFTNAAAAQMRERISQRISAELALHPSSVHLQRQETLLHNAQITTIHSFCMFLLKNHFNEIDIDPAFRVADDGEVKLLMQDVMDSLMEEWFQEGKEEFHRCVEYFCPGGREKTLEDHILKLYRLAESNPWPEDWLRERKQDYGAFSPETLRETDYGRYLTAHIRAMLESCRETYLELQRICQEPDGPYMYGETIDGELAQLEGLLRKNSLEDYEAGLGALNFQRLSGKKDETVSPWKRGLVKDMRTSLKEKTLVGLTKDFFATPLSLAGSQAEACKGAVDTLTDLTLDFMERLRERKAENKVIDFFDMEHYALQILLKKQEGQVSLSQTAREYRQYFREILIDEYQDSNLVQEYLLSAISGEGEGCFNRFMVGDIKQSIYRFRLARPELFLEKYSRYTKEEGCCQRIDLKKNFRSRKEIIDTVNGVFSRIMSASNGGICYDEDAALYVGADYPEKEDCGSELLLVETREAEALAIAQRIKRILSDFQVTDETDGKLRPARCRDMVILLRTLSGWDEAFKKVLEDQGIPVYIESRTGYFAAKEVQELLGLLRVLDNPRQDIPLFGVMKSLFGGFSEEEIALLKSGAGEKKSLYEALEGAERQSACGGGLPEELCKKASAFLEKIRRYRGCTVYMPIRELLEMLVKDSGYLAYVTALPMGGRRRANVEMLLTKASDFEKTSYHGLFHFIRYMEQLEEYDVDYGEADLLDENADVVRIMSIHKSKGLEFPVTFVAGLSKRFNMQDTNSALIADADMGIGAEYVDIGRRIRNKTLRRRVIARKIQEENLAEEMRVLYVAMTRAKEKLIMTASLEDAGERWDKCRLNPSGRLLYHEFIEASSCLDFLLPAAAVPETGIEVKLIDAEALSGEERKEQVGFADKLGRLERAEDYVDEGTLRRLRERFAWEYPYGELKNLYTKTTVSELKIAAMAEKDEAAYHAFEEKEIVPYIPLFRRGEEKISGAVRGNAFHKAMELMDFGWVYRDVDPEAPQRDKVYHNLQEFLARAVESRRLGGEYRRALNDEKLLRFLCSDLARRMYRADRRGELKREQPFVYGVSAGRLNGEYPAQEKVLIQGIIDAYFIEDGAIVLVDYKTDVIDGPKKLWERYGTQMQYYEEALCRLTGLPVKQKILYSFYLGVQVLG